ncbi:MAG: hypothetical protein Q9169_002541 [Polycauliona sp. 2 TL-2023]
MSDSRRGALIVVEGLDRAGKSTQCEKLVRYLEKKGRPVKHMRFPDRSTPIGESIDSYLKGETQQEDHVIHLLFSANRWEAAPHIIEDISNGTAIVIDRYYYSGVVYSAAKNNPDLSLEWAIQPELGLPKPDLCLFLDISLVDASVRGGFGSERYETSEMQKRVRTLFQDLQERPQNKEIVSVNAGQSIDEVHQEVCQLADELLESEELRKPLKSFASF